MSGFLALTRREIGDRRPLIFGTLVAVAIPLLARVQPWLRPEMRRDVHEALAGLFGIAFPIALAIGLGASVVGEDLAQRRLGFYFSRPVSGLAIWASKTLAATLITLGTAAAFLGQVLLLNEWRPEASLPDVIRKLPEWIVPWTVILVALVLTAQAVAGAYRSRDGLFAWDIAVFAVLVAGTVGLVWRLFAAGAAETLRSMLLPAFAVAVLAAAGGSALQVMVGRADPRRGHLALSACLWGTLSASLLGAGLLSSWILSVKPAEVGAEIWSVRANSSGTHVAFVAGHDRLGYRPMFLLEAATGRFDRLPWLLSFGGFAFSGDGRRAVWIESGDEPALVLRRLDAPGTSPIRSILPGFEGQQPGLAQLSADGRLAALTTRGRVAVVDTDSGRQAASVSFDQLGVDLRKPLGQMRCAFAGNEVVVFFVPPPAPAPGPLVVSSFDFRTGRISPGPRLDGVDHVRAVRDGHALVSGRRGPLAVVDRTETTVLVAPGSDAVVQGAVFLGDGGVAARVDRGPDRRLLTWDGHGRPTLDVEFPAGASALLGEPRRGWLALALGLGRPLGTSFVDLATGRVVREDSGLVATVASSGGADDPPPAGSPGARIFAGIRGEVVSLDPETGRREAVIVAAPPGAAE